MTSPLPIGVFDSGIGGLSILDKIHGLLPAESLIYVADSAHAPYGPRGDAFILDRSRRIMAFFHDQCVKAVVVACNTATAAAIATLREENTIPIVGMEPAVKPAAAKSRSGIIGVLATEGTLASDKFVDLKSRFDGRMEIITQPCPGLVDALERLEPDDAVIRALLEKYIPPLVARGADTLVLGCTHYTFITAQIRQVAGDRVAIVDTDDAVARRLASVLAEKDLLADTDAVGEIRFYTSGDLAIQRQLLSRSWGGPIAIAALP